jgi:hypothetical protein
VKFVMFTVAMMSLLLVDLRPRTVRAASTTVAAQR